VSGGAEASEGGSSGTTWASVAFPPQSSHKRLDERIEFGGQTVGRSRLGAAESHSNSGCSGGGADLRCQRRLCASQRIRSRCEPLCGSSHAARQCSRKRSCMLGDECSVGRGERWGSARSC
jgi:hypothetical protein